MEKIYCPTKIVVALTRRRFLKFVGIGALAMVVPAPKTIESGPLTCRRIPIKDVSIKSRKVEFNPNCEYGRGAECKDLRDSFVLRHLHRDAKRVLPKGTPYELRMMIPSFIKHPELGGRPMMAWYGMLAFSGQNVLHIPERKRRWA